MDPTEGRLSRSSSAICRPQQGASVHKPYRRPRNRSPEPRSLQYKALERLKKKTLFFALQQEPNAAKYGMISRTKTMQVVEIINFQVNILR